MARRDACSASSIASCRNTSLSPTACWLFRIAHYRCIEFYRRRKPHVSLDETPEADTRENRVSPEVSALCQQDQLELMQAMQQLPVNQRAVVELKFFGQFTFDEIAEQLDEPLNNVKVRLLRAKKLLAAVINQNQGS